MMVEIENKKNENKQRLDEEIIDFLEDPLIFNRITLDEFDKTIASEEDTRRAIFLSMCGIFLKNSQSRLHTLINSESSSGKSHIGKAIWDIFPVFKKEYRTKISKEAFTYWHNTRFDPEWDWDGKVCYLEDARNDILNSDTFKVMATEGSIATVVQKQKAIDIIINGHPTFLITTAYSTPNFEIINRFNIIGLNETKEQTKKIFEMQAVQASTGTKEIYDELILDSIYGLEQIRAVIPFANGIIPFFPLNSIRARRDLPRFFDLIKASVALHQFQRDQRPDGNHIAQEQDYNLAKEALEKIQKSSSIGGIGGIPYRLKKCYESCLELSKIKGEQIEQYIADEKEPIGKFTADEIFTFNPFMGKNSWYENLERLAEKGLLRLSTGINPQTKRQVLYHEPIIDKPMLLPKFNKILDSMPDQLK